MLASDATPPAFSDYEPIAHERARERGHPTLDGRAMLVHQAARAFAIWTGLATPIDVMTRTLDDDLRAT